MSHDRPRDRTVLPLLLLFATLAGWMLRQWAGYPPTLSDERNWIAIAEEVSKGVNWPISGPLHFETSQALAAWTDRDHASALATLGLASIPAVLLAYAVSYRLMGFSLAWPSLLLLCTSTYFWSPLLESRPQQWGQALVMLCATSAWHLLSRKSVTTTSVAIVVWLAWSVLFALTCWVHLLSGAIAFTLSAILALLVVVWQPTQRFRFAGAALAALPGLLVLGLPEGPYRAMWRDIRAHHVQFDASTTWAPLAVMLLVVVVSLALFRKRCAQGAHFCLRSVEAHPKHWAVGLSAGAVLAMTAQAAMLPTEAWVYYQGSIAMAAMRHIGNVFFFCLFVAGVVLVWTNSALRHAPPWPGQTALLGGAALLALAALMASTALLHTNWMLRVINYALPVAAPFAAVGFSRWEPAAPYKFGALCLTVGLSLAFAGQPAFEW